MRERDPLTVRRELAGLEPDAARRGKRALRQPRSRRAGVVLTGRDVVRPLGIEQAREHLDVAPPDAELELPAAVHADPARIAVLDAFDQALQLSEPRRLDVQPPGR